MVDTSARKVAAVFAREWSSLPAKERGDFYQEVARFMAFYTSTTAEFRAILRTDLTRESV